MICQDNFHSRGGQQISKYLCIYIYMHMHTYTVHKHKKHVKTPKIPPVSTPLSHETHHGTPWDPATSGRPSGHWGLRLLRMILDEYLGTLAVADMDMCIKRKWRHPQTHGEFAIHNLHQTKWRSTLTIGGDILELGRRSRQRKFAVLGVLLGWLSPVHGAWLS